MKKITLLFALIFPILSFANTDKPLPSASEWKAYIENMQPSKYEKIRDVHIEFIAVDGQDYHAFKHLIMEVGSKYAAQAGAEYPSFYELTFGEYDFMLIWPDDKKYSRLDWETTQTDIDMIKLMEKELGYEQTVRYMRLYNRITKSKNRYHGRQLTTGSDGKLD